MQSSSLLALLAAVASAAAQATGKLGDAKAITDSPKGAAYIATFSKSGAITGVVNATSEASGKGVAFSLEIQGLKPESGPYSKTFSIL